MIERQRLDSQEEGIKKESGCVCVCVIVFVCVKTENGIRGEESEFQLNGVFSD